MAQISSDIGSLTAQESFNRTRIFVDGQYRIYIRCSECRLVFHADCAHCDLEDIITGDNPCICDVCANRILKL
ncbi:hypothetical protein DPMN_184064 [Dreissena polymorpha]|uniref:Zinc finger PHD-type domain-containing protein n=1 Tax=Dreissena polymorpha TaxID=45954 RepID=A0A9D4DII0_DREPO|nr:hypothetical protein DPMN_184064 [Dreissena polymorpha]